MAIPENLNALSKDKNERDKILRYLLLRVLINQQARIDKVRELSINLSEKFKDDLFFEPFKISEIKLLQSFKEVAGEKGSLLYRVGALGGIKPVSLFLYRFKAYEGFIRWLNEEKLNFVDVVIEQLQSGKTLGLFNFLNTHPVLTAGWVGNDPKACRMFVNWVLFLFNEIWNIKIAGMEETLMIVDGHVGKVFCRTGLLENVIFEEQRPFIIQASKMRPEIEKIVSDFGRIPFYVDNGAFYIFEDGYCTDIKPKCDQCPINEICMKYTKWTAYQKLKRRDKRRGRRKSGKIKKG